MYSKMLHFDTLWKTKKKISKSPSATWKTDVHLYKGSFDKKKIKMQSTEIEKIYDSSFQMVMQLPKKVIVFDLDETLGSFSDLYSLWNILKLHYVFLSKPDGYVEEVSPKYLNGKERSGNISDSLSEKDKVWHIKQRIFNQLLDLYPEFLRHGILSILKFIHKKITSGECKNIYIFTNNQCIFPEWITLIISYLNYNLGEENTIFEKPVCAFKIDNHIVESCRTSTEKTHADFIKCTLLPRNTEICFVDDREYPRMKNEKIYYIQPPPYFHSLSKKDIVDRFFNSKLYLLSLANAKITSSSVLSIGVSTPSKNVSGSTTSRGNSAKKEIMSLREIIEKHYNVYGNWENHADIMGFSVDLNTPTAATAIAKHNHEIYMKLFYYIREFFLFSPSKIKTKRNRTNLSMNRKTKRKL